MKTSTITVDVQLNDDRVPEAILWKASDSTIENAQKAKATCRNPQCNEYRFSTKPEYQRRKIPER